MRSLTSSLILATAALSMSACVSVPSEDKLLTGISPTKLSQGAAVTAKSASDPTCVEFYKNVNTYMKKAQSSQRTKNVFSRIGLAVAGAVVANEIVPSGINSQTGRIAARAAAGTATSAGGYFALRELNSSDKADAKIIEVAENIGCPVRSRP